MDDNFLLLDEEDVEVLRHRNAHFGGNFAIMLEYYQTQNKGALLDEERIDYLQRVEEELGEDLAPYLLRETDFEQIAAAQEAYRQLRALYEGHSKGPIALANLILSEESEEEEALEAVTKEGNKWLGELIQLLEAPDFASPLFPGYGYAPALAARALGAIGDERSIIPLFEAIGHENEFIDAAALEALVQFGEPAKQFLLQRLKSPPFNQETGKAAAALSAFKEDEEIGKCALEMLGNPGIAKATPLSIYLAICCSGLKKKEDYLLLEQVAQHPALSKEAREELLLLYAQRSRKRI
ncbi:MAG: HEAT repeat domain-containing protein [Verrucomicrobia bacterium]|nr:HEAT repeat domain-containing protein [Verrucomicrobiota bacterium]